MFRIICIILGYFVGCIQTAYYVSKIMAKIDIREHGSGNAGTTNVTRVLGLKAGLITFISDILKALVVYVVCSIVFKGSGTFYSYIGEGANGLIPGMYGGFGLIIGHNFPFQLKFKGGKGIASTLGVFLCIDPKIAFISYVVGFIIVLITKYISAASLAICFIFTLIFALSGNQTEETAIVIILCVMAYYRHRSNIKRLLSGTENKFTIKKAEKN